MRRALVTGGAGFIGSHLTERLLAEGYAVVVLDNLYTGRVKNLDFALGNPALTFVEGDVRTISIEDSCFLHPFDEIYNLACPASPIHYQATPLATLETSLKGIELSLRLVKRDGAKLLHASTSEVYGDALVHPQHEHYFGNVNPLGIRSCYDEGKRVAETWAVDYVRAFDVDARLVRIFNTYGPKMHPQDGRVVSNFIMQALRGEALTLYGTGEQTRSFQYVSDLVEAFRRYMALPKDAVRAFASAHGFDIPVINVGNPGEFTIRALAEKVLTRLGRPLDAMRFLPLPGDDPKVRRPDITLAAALLAWEPTVALDEGLEKTIDYFKGV